jgi:hypothetical protein
MTKSDFEALRSVLNDRRVAVQCVSNLPYFVDGAEIARDSWQPIALLPVRAGNLATLKWTMHREPSQPPLASGTVQVWPLMPQPIRFTADQFAISN